jgi:integrase
LWAKEHGAPLPDFVGSVQAGRHHRRAAKFLDASQVRALLHAARPYVIETPIALAALAGMRRNELRLARVEDVHLSQGRLVVHGSKGHADRTVPIPPLLAEVLQRRMPEAGALVDFGVEFIESTYRHLAALCRTAGVPVISWHGLRHSYAVAMIESGARLDELQAALGHVSLATTGRYLHARPEGISVAAGRAFGI